jgi:hypothetical protein
LDSAFEAIPKTQTAFVCDPTTSKPVAYVIQDEETIEGVKSSEAERKVDYASATSHKFAAATVLAAMRRMRRYYFSAPYTVNSTNATSVKAEGAHPPASSGSCTPSFNGPFDNCMYMYNTTDDGSTGNNMGVMPRFWSDVQAHFYTMAPHYRHACWTGGFYSGMNSGCHTPFSKSETYTDQYAAISDFCSGSKTVTDGCANFGSGFPYVTATYSAYNLMWVNPKTHAFVPLPESIRTNVPTTSEGTAAADIPKIQASQFVKQQRAAGHVNVWDYIMHSPTQAFDWEQQQAVLNAYYADDKLASGDKTPFNPCDAAECTKWRAQRPGDPGDGSHCRSSKTQPPNNSGWQ